MKLEDVEKKISRIKRYTKIDSNIEIRIGTHNGESIPSKGIYYDEDTNSIIIF